MKRFLAGLLLGLAAPITAEPHIATVCQKVILPYVVNCSQEATFANGWTPLVCNRA